MLGLEVSSLPHSLENLLERKNFAGLFHEKWRWLRGAFTILVRGAGGGGFKPGSPLDWGHWTHYHFATICRPPQALQSVVMFKYFAFLPYHHYGLGNVPIENKLCLEFEVLRIQVSWGPLRACFCWIQNVQWWQGNISQRPVVTYFRSLVIQYCSYPN